MTSEHTAIPSAVILTHAIFTERELETVRRCCRDADATQPLHALVAALLRGERDPSPPLPSVATAAPPIPRVDADVPRVPLPPAPGRK